MFGAEFLAVKIVMETLLGIIYKLRIMGVSISGWSYICGDNILVIHNTHRLEYNLKKKSNSICYHAVCESISIGKSLTGHIGTSKSCADVATNVLYGGKRRFHVSNLLYNIYDYFGAFGWKS